MSSIFYNTNQELIEIFEGKSQIQFFWLSTLITILNSTPNDFSLIQFKNLFFSISFFDGLWGIVRRCVTVGVWCVRIGCVLNELNLGQLKTYMQQYRVEERSLFLNDSRTNIDRSKLAFRFKNDSPKVLNLKINQTL